MRKYVPMAGPHPGERYMPSNGTEGHACISGWCGTCQRDKAMSEGFEIDECDDDEVCEIIGASFRNEAVEWRELEDGRCICIAYVPAGAPMPVTRCEHTAELFDNHETSNVEVERRPEGASARTQGSTSPIGR